MEDNSSKNKQIAKNTIYLYIRMVFVLIVGLYTSRVVLNVLGVSDYGVYNVVAGFVSLFSFLNATLSSSLQRFYNYEGGNRGETGYTEVFSVGVKVHLLLALVILLLLETVGIWYINNIMVLPGGRLASANILFQFSVISLFLVIIEIPFTSVIIAKEKMDFYAVVSILDVILKLVIVIVLPYASQEKLIAYGFLLLCVTIIDFLLYFGYTKIKFKDLKVQKNTNRSLLKQLLSFSGWNLLGTFVFMLKGQGLNLLLNAFFGTVVNAARGVAYQVHAAITGFSTNISVSFRPQMVSSYAEGNTQRAYNLFKTQSKICFCLILMIITPVIFEIDLLLKLWLGNVVPQDTNIFTILVLIDALVCTLNSPVTQIVFATGKIKNYQILTSIINIFLLPICWVLLRLGMEAWVVFMVTIIISIINQIIAILAMNRVFSFSIKDYLKQIILPCILMMLIVPLVPYLLTCVMQDSIFRLIIVSFLSFLLSSVLLYSFFLSESEKNIARSYLKKFFPVRS